MILAVDPGLATCGWAVVAPSTGEVVDLGVVISPSDPDADDTVDRARREAKQCAALLEVARRHRVTRIVAESVSLGGPPRARLPMALSLSLSWGGLCMLAIALGAELLEVKPKVWQHQCAPGLKRIDYDKLFAAIAAVLRCNPDLTKLLRSIAESDRNHALDACGIGFVGALMPQLATVIVARRAA